MSEGGGREGGEGGMGKARREESREGGLVGRESWKGWIQKVPETSRTLMSVPALSKKEQTLS